MIYRGHLNFLLFSFLILFLYTEGITGMYADEFLKIGVGPKPMAMGNAFSALADDGSAFYWNPAGIANRRVKLISFMYDSHLQYSNFFFSGIMLPAGRDAMLAFNWIRFSVDNIVLRPDISQLPVEERRGKVREFLTGRKPLFNSVEEAYYFTFARSIKSTVDPGWRYLLLPFDLYFGLNFKFLRKKLLNGKAFGSGMDLGILLKFNLEELFDVKTMGYFATSLVIRDLTNTKVSWNTGVQDEISRNLIFGFLYLKNIERLKSSVSVDLDFVHDGSPETKMGVCLDYRGVFSYRMGLLNRGFAAGVGINFPVGGKEINMEYAFISSELKNNHKIGLSIRL